MFHAKSQVISASCLLFLSVVILHCLALVSASLICRRIPNLTAQQLKICQQSPEILPVVRAGIQLALDECQQLFRHKARVHSAWNCSSWIEGSLNRLYVDIKNHDVVGTKEASLAHALFSAGVTYALSEACTRGNFPYCTCGKVIRNDPSGNASFEWKWRTCGHNVQFGTATTRRFLDSVEQKNMSPFALVNLHNNKVGRRIVRESVKKQCQCHGFSGACTFRTCWHAVGTFREVTQNLYDRYSSAKMVSYTWMMDKYKNKFLGSKRSNFRQAQQLYQGIINLTRVNFNQPNPYRKNDMTDEVRNRDLVYIKSSQNYCRLLKRSSLTNLRCDVSKNSTSTSLTMQTNWPPAQTCDSLCCGGKLRSRTVIKTERCECQFVFCCKVECKMCSTLVTEYDCA